VISLKKAFVFDGGLVLGDNQSEEGERIKRIRRNIMDIKHIQPQVYVLMPFRDEYEPVYETLKDAARISGMTCTRSDKNPKIGNIIHNIIRGIYESDVVIADITGNNPNVFYELGVANALSKPCPMIRCRSADPFPFDVTSYTILQYENSTVGLKNLKEKLVSLLQTEEDIAHPVNDALETIIQRTRLVTYILYGASGGALLGALTSYAGIVGDFCRPVMKTTTFGMVTAGSLTGLLGGAIFFGAYAFLWNIGSSKATRTASTIAGGILGTIIGVLLFASTQAILRGTENQPMAWSVGLAYLLISCLSGTIFGLSVDIRRRQPAVNVHSLFMHTFKVIALSFALMGTFVIVLNLFKQSFFDAVYLQHYRLMDSVGAALRFGLWFVSMLILQWWLKWQRKL
jgi:nucleoside 2-deoxyribosyltransferase